MIRIVPIADVAAADIDQLLDDAFGTDRHGRTAYKLRAGMTQIAGLSFAAVRDGELIGSIQSWPIQLRQENGEVTPLILVGPVAVRPDHQRDGIGRMLTIAMLNAADARRSEPLTLIGDPEYYDRFFGFKAEPTAGWQVPGPVERRRLLARLRAGQTVPSDGRLEPRHMAVALEQAPQ